MSAIDVRDLHFTWTTEEVLKGIDLVLEPGELLCLLGPNGTGKTTLVENILGSVAPDSGSVRVLGVDPRKAPAAFWSRIGLVQQNWSDHPKWPVREQLEWIRVLHSAAGATRSVEEVLSAVGLADKARSKLSSLSGGQRRRIDFAAALISDPEVLILDEPTTGLDPVSKAEIHDLVADCVDRGAAVVYTTHDLAEAHKIASVITIMRDGRIAVTGTADQILAAHSHCTEVTWVEDGRTHVHSTETPEEFLRELLRREVHELTVTRPTLEDAYLALMKKEQNQ
ncbi:ABC transporter ATP-binding protein [Schaalia sp. 19OD2882]|uniref:ABC transporter ATP-binding protein n=1 Tax=Schaalia sp. 19OD2882 TaxID=2794089 RepID=UPI001C1F17B8|nr:ABC transporter ATP-binding protein [Schaalia sp. 19OD2882]QWW19305.1 ABC transporter ATP-binding protein [Schaalia sp. 19OD2882]